MQLLIADKHHLNGEAFIDLSEEEVAELTESIGLRHKLLAQITDAREKENVSVIGCVLASRLSCKMHVKTTYILIPKPRIWDIVQAGSDRFWELT